MDLSPRAAPVTSAGKTLCLGSWQLAHDAWAPRSSAWLLVHDQGKCVPLTRVERALVQHLFEAVHNEAHPDTLVQVALQAWDAPANRPLRATANIPVVVGRLRARARKLGLTIPIQRVAARYCWVV
ncbi:MAG TPA: hypothetical protein VF285_01805 [Castellaniella sp.]|uniref:hypothetical protein n=1 Tax=Castellaniella sp. TaxID=1955812 RepID=UPI002F089B43